jgi:endonuclease/exonuclease/phosphatase family metal-dependent hydrolase
MGATDAKPLRIVAGNITSGNNQSYDEGSGVRIFQALQPDVALVQEMNFGGNSPSAIRSFVDTAFGKDFVYYRGSGQIPNGIVSRYPIVESGEWVDPEVSNRTFAWARIDIPGSKDLWALSLHLLTRSESARRAEGVALIAEMKNKVPAGDYVTIGGDFNTDRREESVLSVFSERVVASGPYPVDQANNGNTSSNRSKPYDWVLVDPTLSSQEKPFVLKSSSSRNGLVFDTRTYKPLNELMPPLKGGESAASNMQHMAVARQFEIDCKKK